MTDFNRLGAGKKLIKEIISKSGNKNLPWTRFVQQEKLNKQQKNPHTKKSRLEKK
jgi:hypothetical protein